jgi:fumarate reductase flavoprotein subunit
MSIANIKSCDLVVLGAGGGGLLAAVKAKDMGVKNVIVLEKAKKPGGCTWFSGACPGPFRSTPEQLDARFRSVMKALWWSVNPKLMRNNLEAASQCFDWFSKIVDVTDFYPKSVLEGSGDMMSMFRSAERRVRHINDKSRDPSIGPGSGGSWGVTKLLGACEKMGIPILTETRATEFIKDSQGNIKGVLAEANDGKLQVNCKACVVATGGFGANPEKLKKRWPYHFNGKRIHRFTCPTDEGDALDMAEKAGIYVDWDNMQIQVGGPAHHPYSYSIYRIMWQPEVVYVNLNGERWIDETETLTGGFLALGQQPNGEVWTIVDEDLKELLGTRLAENPSKYTAAESDKWILKDFRDDIAYEISLDEGGAPGKHTRKGDTLEELAKKIGADPKNLVETIKRYNEFCDNKRDLDFSKKPEYLIPLRKPPFYAFWGQRFAETTHGGIVINENMEVLRSKGKNEVVPGLFAAGDISGGWTIDVPGMPAVSAGQWMVSSGYLAGVAAGKYLGKA